MWKFTCPLKGSFLKTKENDDLQACKLHLYEKDKKLLYSRFIIDQGVTWRELMGSSKASNSVTLI